MKKYSQAEIEEILESHSKWLDEEGGQLADLSCSDLSGLDLRFARLSYAKLIGVDFSHAILRGAMLNGALLTDAKLSDAILSRALLSGAILIGATLNRADLSNAMLNGTVGNMGEVKSISLEKYPVTYTSKVMQIGCQQHPIEEWWEFTDDEIDEMDIGALDWWTKWKDTIKNIIDMSPAVDSGNYSLNANSLTNHANKIKNPLDKD